MGALQLSASKRPCFLWLVMLLGVAAGVAQGQVRGQPPAVPPPRDFADFLLARDLVVEGRLLAADPLMRTPLGTCGVSGMGPYKSLDLRVAVDRVRFGTADDSVLIISTLGRPTFPPGVLIPGAHVIAWAFRNCHDGWRLWGGLCVVTPGGRVLSPLGEEQAATLLGQPTTEAIRYSALDSVLTARAAEHSTTAFEGSANVALLRVVGTTRRGNDGFTYQCDSIGWVLGGGSRTPRYVDFPRVPGCYPEVFPGDSLLAPVPTTFTGDRLVLSVCPRALKLQNQFTVGFGVPLSFIRYALQLGADGLHVRPYIAKE